MSKNEMARSEFKMNRLAVYFVLLGHWIADWWDHTTARVVHAMVPLASMFGYATDLRSKSQGRASYNMEFDHYIEVPRNIAEEIIKKNQ